MGRLHAARRARPLRPDVRPLCADAAGGRLLQVRDVRGLCALRRVLRLEGGRGNGLWVCQSWRQQGGGEEDEEEQVFIEHHDDHIFLPFSSGGPTIGGVPMGPSGLLTVLVPARGHGTDVGSSDGGEGRDAPGEAALAAAEVAFAAVRSLALAPLASSEPPLGSLHGTSSGLASHGHSRRHQTTRSLRR
mmetsp:Transcript_82886/g.215926  ORF Transcript_82886/g.215926 Transcript_82886/m.215926 type:complete len:189 (-) Transcript_82886:50-616(-)